MTPDTKDALAQAYADLALYVSLHTGDPGPTGANELSGVTRVALMWTPDGTTAGLIISDDVDFDLADDTDLTHVGIWSALTGGDLVDSRPNAVSFPTATTYTFNLTYQQNATA